MSKHVIKFEYIDGEKQVIPEVWCGRKVSGKDFMFKDAQHVALAINGSIEPCKSCIKTIIKVLQTAL